MLQLEPSGKILGATVHGLDLSMPLSADTLSLLIHALADHGVLRFPAQRLTAAQLKRFSEAFGDVQTPSGPHEAEVPEVSILSNVVEEGRNIGTPDAGRIWHTDMTYNKIVGYVNVLYGLKIPRRGDTMLGGTQFSNMAAAYRDLPEAMKHDLADAQVLFSTDKYNRAAHALSSPGGDYEAWSKNRHNREPVPHPLFLTHPVSGNKMLYCNPGYATAIEGLPKDESDAIIAFFVEHQLQEKYLYTFTWSENDVLIWDNLATIHRAIADYGPDEHRLIKRCQVMATKIFDAAFLKTVFQ